MSLTVTTYDGRTASASNTVSVGSHDVGIAKLATPSAARSGQTKTITVALSNRRYAETVQVDLYRILPSGPELVGSLTKSIPVLPAKKVMSFDFTYTFNYEDAVLGKTTFQAVATIIGARDIQPGDNTQTSTPTRVLR